MNTLRPGIDRCTHSGSVGAGRGRQLWVLGACIDPNCAYCAAPRKLKIGLPNAQSSLPPRRRDRHARARKRRYQLSEKSYVAPQGAALQSLRIFPSDADDCPKNEHFPVSAALIGRENQVAELRLVFRP
jgi:hypothetical protein